MWRKIGLVLVGMFGALVLSAQVAGPPGLVGIVAGGLSQAAADALYVALAGGIMTGQLVNRLDPAGTALTDASVLVNPGTCAAGEFLLATGVAGASRLSTDCAGNTLVAGTLGVTGATTLSSTLDAKGTISNSGAGNSGNVLINDTVQATGLLVSTASISPITLRLQATSGYNSIFFQDQTPATKAEFGFGGSSASAPYTSNMYYNVQSGTKEMHLAAGSEIWSSDVNGIANSRTDLFSGDVRINDTLNVTGAVKVDSTLDVRGLVSNGGAATGGAVGFSDDTILYGANPAYQIVPSGWSNNAFYFQAGVTVTGAAGGDYAYLGVPTGKGMVHYIGSQRALELTSTEVVFSTIPKLPIGTYATTDCDAAAEVGRQVMHNDGANHISLCACEQTGAATYAFKAASATGVCP